MPAKTHTAALPEAAKRFEFLDVKVLLLFFSISVFNIADVVKLRSPTKMDQVVHRTQCRWHVPGSILGWHLLEGDDPIDGA
jgi:hypothetical protein